MTEKIAKLKTWIDETDNIVFFGGAGVSTESGLKDFRSVDGLYYEQWDEPPETILSHSYACLCAGQESGHPQHHPHRRHLYHVHLQPHEPHHRLCGQQGQIHHLLDDGFALWQHDGKCRAAGVCAASV
ncbi:MAG: hypothetical protein IIV78_00565, partial [Oscillospiraceae bacterium]|nr:hypothetical protein [Oscillospiraceae bacterium]